MARTTAVPTATAAATSNDRPGSRSAGRTMRRKKSVSAAISGMDDAPVAHTDHAIHNRGGFHAMRGHEDCGALLIADLAEQLDNGSAGGGIQIAGRLIG